MGNDWIKWELPNENELFSLAKILTKHVYFLKPEIVKQIVDDNEINKDEWSEKLRSKNVRPEIYLWNKSPCVFPGVRRHSGKVEISLFKESKKKKNHYSKIEQSVKLDDNSYPKELWSYSIRGKKYDKSNPDNYQLAHIFDHKDYQSKNRLELKGPLPSGKYNFSGLYTSATNTCFVPATFLKPTDHNQKLRRLLQDYQKHLYEGICNILPYELELSDSIESWDLNKFDVPKLVGDIKNINKFLKERKKVVDSYLS